MGNARVSSHFFLLQVSSLLPPVVSRDFGSMLGSSYIASSCLTDGIIIASMHASKS